MTTGSEQYVYGYGHNSMIMPAPAPAPAPPRIQLPFTMKDLPTEMPKASEKKSIIPQIQDEDVQEKQGEKSKAQLRAERREKQEAQRAAKAEQSDKIKRKAAQKVDTRRPHASEPIKKTSPNVVEKEHSHQVNFFKHLHRERENTLANNCSALRSKLHPEISKLGIKYASKIIVGSNARCVDVLRAVKQLVEDFERPSQADFTRGLEAILQDSALYLHHCRPLAVSMQNALKYLRWQMSLLPATISDHEVSLFSFSKI